MAGGGGLECGLGARQQRVRQRPGGPFGFVLRHALVDTPTRRHADTPTRRHADHAAHPLPCSSSTRSSPARPRQPSLSASPRPGRLANTLPRGLSPLVFTVACRAGVSLSSVGHRPCCPPPRPCACATSAHLTHLLFPPLHPRAPRRHTADGPPSTGKTQLPMAASCRAVGPAPAAGVPALLYCESSRQSGRARARSMLAAQTSGASSAGAVRGAGRGPGCAERHCGHAGKPAPGPLAARGWPARPSAGGCRYGAPDDSDLRT